MDRHPDSSSKSIDEQMMDAIASGDRRKLTELIQNGADPEIREIFNGWNALHVAASDGDTELLQLLMLRNVCLTTPIQNTGESPIELAAINNHLDVIEMLFRAGAKPTADELAFIEKHASTETAAGVRQLSDEAGMAGDD